VGLSKQPAGTAGNNEDGVIKDAVSFLSFFVYVSVVEFGKHVWRKLS
jgi:hypothetical protein